VDWAEFITTESHGIPPEGDLVKWSELGGKSLSDRQAATIPAREESMANLANVVQQLRKERLQTQRRLEQLDEALKALGSLDGLRGKVGRLQTPGKTRRTMSTAARKRIAAAQRAHVGRSGK